MDKNEAVRIVSQYASQLAEKISFSQCILFGSYAKGIANEESDIDVAIVIPSASGDFFALRPLLWKIRRAVDDRIEPVLFSEDHDESGFLSEIRSHGIIVQ